MADRGERLPQLRELIRLTPVITERMALEAKPADQIAGCYVLTRAATVAWETLNRYLSAGPGALFWIGGAAGTGKTHFLNYVLALDRRAGALTAEEARRITLGLEVVRPITAAQLEAQILESLARALGTNQRGAMLWREMGGGGDALSVALNQAHRAGVRAATLAIDFGLSDPHRGAFEYLETMANVAAGLKELKFTILAAGRVSAPKAAVALDVAAADRHEEVTVAIGRARQLKDEARAAIGQFYQAAELVAFGAEEIFPFHPVSVSELSHLANPPGTVAAIAGVAQDALAAGSDGRQLAHRRLILPGDLIDSAGIARRIDTRLGGAGRAALKAARAALAGLSEDEAALGRQMVATLVLEHLCGAALALDFGQLHDRLPRQAPGATPPVRVLERIAAGSKGAIRVEAMTARFDPLATGAPVVEAFNAALPLAKLFDPTLTPAQEQAEAQAKLTRLGEAMAAALEAANRTGEALKAAAEDGAHKLLPEHLRALADFSALAGAGPTALLEVAADKERREAAVNALGVYETVARAAGAVPRLRAMSEYLEATGLLADAAVEQTQDSEVIKLETECRLLAVELELRGPVWNPRMLGGLEARFNKFKWSYAQSYRDAHARFQTQMIALSRVAEDANRHLDALARLDSIAALGAAAAASLQPAMADLAGRVAPCGFDGPLSPESAPRCRCGFVVGTAPPQTELTDLFDQIKSALRLKLAALSRGAIARLIKEHDRGRRLEGFLKITQAAQTEALVRVLDGELARYLSDLLEEGGAAAASGIVELESARKAGRRSKARA